MYATAEGTARYEARFPAYRETAFYRSVQNLSVSSLGIGTYLGRADDATDRAYTDALIAAGLNGINFFDTAINYRNQRSERCVGAALEQLQRDEIVVCTKAGFLTPGAAPPSLKPEDVVGGIHSMAPEFLADQVDRSRSNLRVDTIDVFYLHNPETQLGFVDMAALEQRLRRAFDKCEQLADEEKIRWYGVATWDGLRKKGGLDLARIVRIAEDAGGPDHHFRFAQLPFNLAMVEAWIEKPESVLEKAARLGVAVVASASLMQARVLDQMPEAIAERMTGLTPAQRAIQFTRSTPGIAVALTGMSRREHVLDNLGIAGVPPVPLDQYLGFYR
jgi:aryl-alcohol dehydrogenase-like predicted oxidoreductase